MKKLVNIHHPRCINTSLYVLYPLTSCDIISIIIIIIISMSDV